MSPLSTDVPQLDEHARAAVMTALLAVSGMPGTAMTLALENRPFTAPAKTKHARVQWAPGEPRQINIGRAPKLLRFRGSALVDLYFPAGEGDGDAMTLAGAIVAAFPPGLQLTYAGQRVTITNAFRTKGKPSNEWYQIPVTIAWWADVLDTTT